MSKRKLENTYEEDFVLHVSEQDEKEFLENLGFTQKPVLEYDPYQQKGWDD